jgi:hypothetical protein
VSFVVVSESEDEATMTNTNTIQLLNDDGTASMATALLMSHHGFRRDLGHFAVALRALVAGDPSRIPALRDEWKSFRATLHGHHEQEDAGIFPGLRAQRPELAPVMDELSAQHRLIDPLLERGDHAFAVLETTTGAAEAAAVVTSLSTLITTHLTLEEAHVPAFLRGAKEFPLPPTPEVVAMYAQGFAWASRGVAPDILALVDAMLPAPVREALPAARAAFEARCLRVWGPTTPTTSRTPIPSP